MYDGTSHHEPFVTLPSLVICDSAMKANSAFPVAATRGWFASLGVELKQEPTGKLFPVTDSARTVLRALLTRCKELAVEIHTQARVLQLAPDADGFIIEHSRGGLRARTVIMATGGRSLPRTGSDGSGWALVRALHHRVTETVPALVPLILDAAMFHAALSGVSQPVELSTFAAGKLIDRRRGSLLWTHFGISGPVVLDASRHWTRARAAGAAVEMRCNFLPGENFEEVDAWLVHTVAQRPRLSLAKCLAAKLPAQCAVALAHRAGCDPGLPLAQLGRGARRALVHLLVACTLPVVRERGWNYAEVTAGGVPLDEIDYRTMHSRRVPGLYLIGEMLDCDGRIGGFNFQWAWATGFLAGRAAAVAVCGPGLTQRGRSAMMNYG